MIAEYRGVTGHYIVRRKTREEIERVIKSIHSSTKLEEWTFSEDKDENQSAH
jgi:hypothetical protein